MKSSMSAILIAFSLVTPVRPADAQGPGDTIVVLPGDSLVDPGRMLPHRVTWRRTHRAPDGGGTPRGLWTDTWARSTEDGRPVFLFRQLWVDTTGTVQLDNETVFDAERFRVIRSRQRQPPQGLDVSYRYRGDTVSGTLQLSADAEPRQFEVVFDEPVWDPLTPVSDLVPLERLEVGDVLRYPVWNQTGSEDDVTWREHRVDSIGTTVTTDGRSVGAWYLTSRLAAAGSPVFRLRQTVEAPYYPWFVGEGPTGVREYTLVDWEPFAPPERAPSEDGRPFGAALARPSPDCDAPGHRQFDFWIGEWDVVNRQRNPAAPEDTTLYETGRATNRVYPILGGCAIVEHWEGNLSYGTVLGFSVRAWDPSRDVWTLVLNWPQPGAAGFSTLEGAFENGIGSFRREGPGGRLIRYRFMDITRDGLTWEGSASGDDGASWDPFWVMDFRRRPPQSARALLNGPSRTLDRCPAERSRSFDFLIGDWRGEEREVGPDGTAVGVRPVSVRASSILDGCAVMDLVTYGDDPLAPADRFRVRSFVEAEDRWVQYSLDRGDPSFARWESGEGEDRALAMVAADGRPELERVRWLEVGPDEFRRQRFTSGDGGATWRLVAEATLTRR